MEVHSRIMLAVVLMPFMASAYFATQCRKGRIPIGGRCCDGTKLCKKNGICDPHLKTCRIPVGASGCGRNSTERNMCVTSAICESDVCRIPYGSVCVGHDLDCQKDGVCDSGICRIPYGSVCVGHDQNCQKDGVCDSGICGCPAPPGIPQKSITSLNYPKAHDHDVDKTWNVTAAEGQVILVEFIFFSLERDENCTTELNPLSSDCEYDYVELSDDFSTSGKICGTGCPKSYVSQTNTVLLHFKTDDLYTCTGFKAAFYFIEPPK